MTLVTLVLVGLVMLYGKMRPRRRALPRVRPAPWPNVNIRFPQGTNIYQTDALAQAVEQRLAPYVDVGDLEHIITNVGSGGGDAGMSGGSSGGHLANVTLKFHDFEGLRRRPSADAVADIRAVLTDIPGSGNQGREG